MDSRGHRLHSGLVFDQQNHAGLLLLRFVTEDGHRREKDTLFAQYLSLHENPRRQKPATNR